MVLLQEILVILSIIASIFWWFQLLFAFIVNRRQEKNKTILPNLPKISVLIPVYNEPEERINATIQSVLNQKFIDFEVIVVDDGSLTPVKIDSNQIKIIRTENRGKRDAQITGIAACQYDWIATVDSDTHLEENAIAHLLTLAIKEKLDAATGSVFLSNEKTNLLTRMTACMYWFSFYQERASHSFFGSVMCCSGALSIYKKDIIIQHQEEYLNQRFFGHLCTAGDDRHLTNLFLLSGHRVGWSANAISYTHSPDKMLPFLKQQLRWIRSHISSFYYIGHRIKDWKFVFGIFTVKLIFRYFYMMLLYFSMIGASFVTMSLWPIMITLISLLVVTFVKTTIAIMHTRQLKMFNLMIYSLFTFFIFNAVVFYGILTPTKVGWLTRSKE